MKPFTHRYVVSCDDLKQQLDNRVPILIDVRPYDSYLKQHLPGARHFDIEKFRRSRPPVLGLLPHKDEFNRDACRLGLLPDREIVVYDENGGPSAGRFAWIMQAYGHRQIALLDGGFAAWQSLDYPLSNQILDITQTSYTGTVQNTRIADADYILSRLHSDECCILDARSPAEYRGEDVRALRGGHIPGAINLDWVFSKNPANPPYFWPVDELRGLLEAKNATLDKELICYCHSHQRSSLVCVLLDHLGYSKVRGYPGSWSDWGNRTDLPIEKSAI